jgi:hypothetical protein
MSVIVIPVPNYQLTDGGRPPAPELAGGAAWPRFGEASGSAGNGMVSRFKSVNG